jgi:hypothetical protein
MKRGPFFAFFLAACVATGAEANSFRTTVSGFFTNNKIQIVAKQAPIKFNRFVPQLGRRAVAGKNAHIGFKRRGIRGNGIYAHATFVIDTTQAVPGGAFTVNIVTDKVHITSWYPYATQNRSFQCHVFEDDNTCVCDPRGPWNICKNTATSNAIRGMFVAAARASRLEAAHALQQAGVTVTNNP